MRLSEFEFDLPSELIAQYPSEHRDECKLMVLNRKTKEVIHTTFKDILSFFDEGDTFVFNDTKVFPAHLVGLKEISRVEIDILLMRELSEEHYLWDSIVNPARKIRIGNKVFFGDNDELVAEVVDNTTSRGRTFRFLYDGDHDAFKKELYKWGKIPLPSYIDRPVESEDEERFQTIFAKEEGAVLSPAAGLHFSRELLKRMEIKGIDWTFVTSHLSFCSDREIDVEDLLKYKPESEQVIIKQEAVDCIAKTRKRERRVCSVGTSVLKSLEAVAMPGGCIKAIDGWDSRFIFPPYHFEISDALVTNFHLPYSMFYMSACAFGGYDFVKSAYEEAIAQEYQFGDYGDAMLII